MLTGDLIPTSGDAFLLDHSIARNPSSSFASIYDAGLGLCQQQDGLHDLMVCSLFYLCLFLRSLSLFLPNKHVVSFRLILVCCGFVGVFRLVGSCLNFMHGMFSLCSSLAIYTKASLAAAVPCSVFSLLRVRGVPPDRLARLQLRLLMHLTSLCMQTKPWSNWVEATSENSLLQFRSLVHRNCCFLMVGCIFMLHSVLLLFFLIFASRTDYWPWCSDPKEGLEHPPSGSQQSSHNPHYTLNGRKWCDCQQDLYHRERNSSGQFHTTIASFSLISCFFYLILSRSVFSTSLCFVGFSVWERVSISSRNMDRVIFSKSPPLMIQVPYLEFGPLLPLRSPQPSLIRPKALEVISSSRCLGRTPACPPLLSPLRAQRLLPLPRHPLRQRVSLPHRRGLSHHCSLWWKKVKLLFTFCSIRFRKRH